MFIKFFRKTPFTLLSKWNGTVPEEPKIKLFTVYVSSFLPICSTINIITCYIKISDGWFPVPWKNEEMNYKLNPLLGHLLILGYSACFLGLSCLFEASYNVEDLLYMLSINCRKAKPWICGVPNQPWRWARGQRPSPHDHYRQIQRLRKW
jgi:hypothetical protein